METLNPLPGKIVSEGDVSYFIHGLLHDTPLIKMSDGFKEEISKKFNGLSVICEDGFSEWIKNSVSFREIDYLKQSSVSYCQNLFKGLVQTIFGRFSKKRKHLQESIKTLTLDDFLRLRKYLSDKYSQEPEGMNSLLSRSGRGTLENPQGEFPLRIRRYVYEAKTVIDYAKKNDLKYLHVVVGCAHELPLEYLLQNQELLKSLSERI